MPPEADQSRSAEDKKKILRQIFDEVDGPRGPAHLAALFAAPGVAEPRRATWLAVPSWKPTAEFVSELNTEAPAGWFARVANWDYAMPQSLLIYVRDLILSGRCGEEGLAADCSHVRLGVSIDDRWVSWELACEPPPVPNVENEQIWLTP
jgi:hypothetical protein